MVKKRTFQYLLVFLSSGVFSYYTGRAIARNELFFDLPFQNEPEKRINTDSSHAGFSKSRSEKTKKSLREEYGLKVRKMSSYEKIEELSRLVRGNPVESTYLLDILFEEWGKVTPREALEELRKTAGKFHFHQQSLFGGWASRDPEGAAAYYLENRESLYSTHVINQIIHNWAALDPDSAWEWLSKRDMTEQKNALTAFLRAVTINFPHRFGEYLSLISSDVTNGLNVTGLLSAWMDEDTKAADNYLENLSEEQEKAMALSLFEIYLEKNPDKAVEYVRHIDFANMYGIDAYRKTLFGTLGEEEGMKWFIDHLPEKDMVRYIDNGSLVFTSLDECFSWVKKHAKEPIKSKLIASYIEKNSTPHYAVGMELIDYISDAAKRNELKKNYLLNWAESDTTAAQEWLKNSSLPDQDKRSLDKKIRGQRIFK